MTKAQRIRVIAGLAGADVRSVRKFLDGQPVRGNVLRERLATAARQLERIEGMLRESAPQEDNG